MEKRPARVRPLELAVTLPALRLQRAVPKPVTGRPADPGSAHGSVGTPKRTIRVADPLWGAALNRAAARGEDLSTAIRRFLVAYAAGRDAALPTPIVQPPLFGENGPTG